MGLRDDTPVVLPNVPDDIDIAQSVQPVSIDSMVEFLGIDKSFVDPYGHYKGKIRAPELAKELKRRPYGHYVCVSATTPTPLGEGKTTITVGLSQALGRHMGHKVFATMRQPSAGPTFGIKGGAAGGGYSQVIPMEEINLHLTGDIHAVSLAHNLLIAAVESRLFHESTLSDKALFERLVPAKYNDEREFNKPQKRRLARLGISIESKSNVLSDCEISRFSRLNIDPETITIPHVVDINNRALRHVVLKGDGRGEGHGRQTSFDIAVASEIMAIIALAKDLEDVKQRLRRIVVASDKEGNPIIADDLGVAGALMAIIKDAFNPTLMQTIEGTPVFVHAGPFANIAHGSSSVIADDIALRLVGQDGYVLTEAGFGADIGFEKFCNLKCRGSGLQPDCVVLVTTIRSLKYHGGAPPVVSGQKVPQVYKEVDTNLVSLGCPNLRRHITNCRKFGVGVVVAVNMRASDHPDEIEVVAKHAKEAGAFGTVTSTCWAEGGKGALSLASAVVEYCTVAASGPTKFERPDFEFLYPTRSTTIKEKIEIICRSLYGASRCEFTEDAEGHITKYTSWGFGHLPVCIAKTQYSLSHDPVLKGAPTDFVVPVKAVKLSAGAGFLVVLCGQIMTMPALPVRPAYYDVDVDCETGRITGLF